MEADRVVRGKLASGGCCFYSLEWKKCGFITSNNKADPSIDIWAFGKMMYEALTGEKLIDFKSSNTIEEDQESLIALGEWDKGSLCEFFGNLEDLGIGMLGVDLITHCLVPFSDA
eukprot:4097492-Ditylum_brightwellii.AAC.1